jgi:fumarate hydratase class II
MSAHGEEEEATGINSSKMFDRAIADQLYKKTKVEIESKYFVL